MDKIQTGQKWQHKEKGYAVEVVYINRSRQLVVEECGTGQRDGFCEKYFLQHFIRCEVKHE